MNSLVEYKATISSGQAKVSSLSDELLEHEKELQTATNKVEELVSAHAPYNLSYVYSELSVIL